ncbi:MAG TPA: FKBP-type peptidyl-prolyl cis-trans isomerase [Gemmatimonadales bacterium]|nr:FKBP-type peptidyl-prolyl cis-trans isomerase [Gemmatimonadales bacterium]
MSWRASGWLLVAMWVAAPPAAVAQTATGAPARPADAPTARLSLRTQLASPLALLGLSDNLAVPVDSLRRVGRGVWIQDVQVGTGDSATVGRRVDLHHVGMFADGRIFTKTGRKPFSFRLGEGKVIDGWDDGVLGMRVGGRRILVIPSELAYGPSGDGAIPPGAVLVFDVTLVDVH